MGNLKRIGYYSKATEQFDQNNLITLAVEAARFNALDGINGVLFYRDGRFAQIFEGVDEGVNDLLSRLERDVRHSDIKVLFEDMIDTPLFHTWDMRLCRDEVEMNSAVIARLVAKPLPAHIADFIDNFAARLDV